MNDYGEFAYDTFAAQAVSLPLEFKQVRDEICLMASAVKCVCKL